MKRRLIALVVISVLALGLINLVLPQLVADAVAKGMQGILNSSQISAQVEQQPALLMLTGQFARVQLTADAAQVGKISFDKMQAELTQVQLDMFKLLTARRVEVQRLGTAHLTAELTQAELARYLQQSVKAVSAATVQIDQGRVSVTGAVGLGQIAKVNISVNGRVVADGAKIKLVLENVAVQNSLVGKLRGSVLSDIELADLSSLPFGVKVKQIIADQGKLTLIADNL